MASASAPTYDPNVWTGGISAKEYAALTSPTAGTPLLSRATGTAMAPASTLKALSVPAAVAAGNSLTRTYECGSSYRIGNREFRNFESRGYGPITFHKALEISCDTVFYDVAYRSWLALGGLGATTPATPSSHGPRLRARQPQRHRPAGREPRPHPGPRVEARGVGADPGGDVRQGEEGLPGGGAHGPDAGGIPRLPREGELCERRAVPRRGRGELLHRSG